MNKKKPFKIEEQKEMHNEYHRLNRIQLECASKKLQLRKDFCETLPFKVGDYIILGGWIKRQGWITKMIMNESFDYIHIYFSSPKKDGTPSKRVELVPINIMSDLDLITVDRDK